MCSSVTEGNLASPLSQIIQLHIFLLLTKTKFFCSLFDEWFNILFWEITAVVVTALWLWWKFQLINSFFNWASWHSCFQHFKNLSPVSFLAFRWEDMDWNVFIFWVNCSFWRLTKLLRFWQQNRALLIKAVDGAKKKSAITSQHITAQVVWTRTTREPEFCTCSWLWGSSQWQPITDHYRWFPVESFPGWAS